jgi:hypothetical protein
MRNRVLLTVVIATGLSGCASVIDGTSQSMSVATNPEGAECRLMRNGELLARITTPQTVNIKKTKHDINIECEMEGFHKSTEHVNSEIQDATWGNIILGGGIGWAVDSASGADNKYKEHVTITMVPLGQVAPVVAKAEAAEPDGESLPEAVEVVNEAADSDAAASEAGVSIASQEAEGAASEADSVSVNETEVPQPDVVEAQDVSEEDQAEMPNDEQPVDEVTEEVTGAEAAAAAGSQ